MGWVKQTALTPVPSSPLLLLLFQPPSNVRDYPLLPAVQAARQSALPASSTLRMSRNGKLP